MTRLTIYDVQAPQDARQTLTEHKEIAEALVPLGVVLEQWEAGTQLPDDADDAAVLQAYRKDIDRLMAEGGYKSVDVIRLKPDHPDREKLRTKFLSEHRHDDDEVRFFVEGSGQFYLRTDQAVYALQCTRGDLINVPARTRHWFDMGARPRFTAIRLYISPDGWVANFTGDPISDGVPRYESEPA